MDVRTAYRFLAALLHPDRGGTTEAMQALNMLHDAIQTVPPASPPSPPPPPARSDAIYHSRPKKQHPSSNSEFLGNGLYGYQYRETWERHRPEDIFPDAVRSMPKQLECHRGRVVSGHGRITSGGYD